MADEATLDLLKNMARERHVSLAEVVREALQEKAQSYRPKPASIGAGRDGRGIPRARHAAQPRGQVGMHEMKSL